MSQPNPPLPVPTRIRLADQVVAILLDAIVEGRFATDTCLPAERDLAAELSVNRTSVRQAIARLEQMGAVEARQGHGTVVRDLSTATDPALVAHQIARDRGRMLGELFEVREAMAALVGRLAAARATPADRTAIAEALADVEGAKTALDRQQHELTFFRVLVRAARNRPLDAMQHWVDAAYGDSAGMFVEAFADPRPVLTGLGAVAEAVARGDVTGAGAAMTAYATASASRMLSAADRHTKPGRPSKPGGHR